MGIRKAVILAGGTGSRLHPLTLVTNKHLLPLYNKPVIFFAIEKLVASGIDKIMIVVSPGHMDDFVQLLGSGKKFTSKHTGHQIQIVYGIQNKPEGIADGLWIAKEFVGNESCVLHLGDNIIEDDLSEHIQNFESGAKIFLKEVPDPKRFGVVTFNNQGKVTEIIEKPSVPKTHYAVTGIYLYDSTVFEKVKRLKKSDRGEYEITDVSNQYIEEGTLEFHILSGKWFDVGTFDSLLRASNYIAQQQGSTETV